MVAPLCINTNPQKTLLTVPAIFLAFATIAVILRFHVRSAKKQRLLLDDWLCLVGLCLTYGCYASVVIAVVYGGLGKSIFTLMPENIPLVFKALTAVSTLWATTVAVVQLAILALYVRIFKVIRWHAYTCYAAMVVVLAWWASTFITLVTTCIPLDKFWTPGKPGKCIEVRPFCIGSGLTHVFIDIFILVFPLPIIWRLHTARSNKITISIACLLGLFATLGGLLRMDCLIQVLKYDESNFTQSAWIGVLFQLMENACGVICSCAPMLPTFVAKLGNSTFATSIRRFISSNLSRSSLRSGGSGNTARSGRSTHTQGSNRNPTIGSWRVNKIQKSTTFAVTTVGGDSQEHLAEGSTSRGDGASGTSVDIEMDTLKNTTLRLDT
ncbi:hypothetical protein BCR34DRAFT_672729 [Clohesyomyces aquaticus]|uniref:Rhodopsin domain-containing protein n=1 Tax=Clohesyomyces aquaticus TaxID=1231657 RepID=A0A1Y1ZV16_9PLEO|nr:hypothetical protein BCR34DRAFT_672729 [Clohesyomyces aquaticus]